MTTKHIYVALDDCETFTPADSAFIVVIDETHDARDSDDTEIVDGVLECNEGHDLKRIIYRSPSFAAELSVQGAQAEAPPIPGTRVIELSDIIEYYFENHSL